MIISMWIFGALTLITGLGVVFSTKPLNSALWLVATLFLVAVHFALLGADFIAALQVLVYAGAIMVLVVFVIMLLGLEEPTHPDTTRTPRYLAAIFCGAFVGLLAFMLTHDLVFPLGVGMPAEGMASDPREVGMVLLTDYLYPFQLAALLLLAAIIGAVVLAYERKRPLAPGRGLKAVQQKYREV